MIKHYQSLLQFMRHSRLSLWADCLPAQVAAGLSEQRYGDLPYWKNALATLPNITPSNIDLESGVTIGTAADAIEQDQQLKLCFRQLIPWRKGPYNLFDMHIDTEWRSDWKWDRLINHIAPLTGRQVLDVGCGNGYHCLRSYGAGASRVIGIDPSPRFIIQFLMIKHYLGEIPVDVVPVGIESLPGDLAAFNTTFSMGVLYHRRSPMDHLRELKATLVPGGQLVLETLIIEGELGECLVPEDRYAMMRNVWFIPSAPTLLSWMRKCGFVNPRLVDVCLTSFDEQRVTNWMEFQSLADFLDPEDTEKTVEGHPAPRRGIFIAEVP